MLTTTKYIITNKMCNSSKYESKTAENVHQSFISTKLESKDSNNKYFKKIENTIIYDWHK